jgi:hypothetical protein
MRNSQRYRLNAAVAPATMGGLERAWISKGASIMTATRPWVNLWRNILRRSELAAVWIDTTFPQPHIDPCAGPSPRRDDLCAVCSRLNGIS